MKKFVLLLLIALAGFAHAEKGYTHAETGLVFPARLGTLTQGEVTDLSREGAGVAVGYGDKDANVTLYIYGAEIPLDDEAGLLDATLLTLWERNGATIKSHTTRKTKVGQVLGHQINFEVSSGANNLYSQARLYDLGTHRFKMRLTGETKNKSKIDRLAALIAKQMLSGR